MDLRNNRFAATHGAIRLAATHGAMFSNDTSCDASSKEPHVRWSLPRCARRGPRFRRSHFMPCLSPRALALVTATLVLASTAMIALLLSPSESGKGFGDRYVAAWESIRAAGAFRNPHYDRAVFRLLPSGVVVEFNPTHAVSKRPPSARGSALAVVRPFDPAAFNFNRVPYSEVMSVLEPTLTAANPQPLTPIWWNTGPESAASPPNSSANAHALVINASPLWLGHGLLVPALRRGLPQVLSANGILAALELVAVASAASSQSPSAPVSDFRAGFNSLGAYASVNHLHWHTGFMRDVLPGGEFPCERAARAPVAAGPLLRLSRTTGWPLPLLVFEAEPAVRWAARGSSGGGSGGRRRRDPAAAEAVADAQAALARAVGLVAAALQAADVPHSALVSGRGFTVFLAPRRGQVHLQALQAAAAAEAGGGGGGGGVATGVNVAVAEMCGLAVALTPEAYDAVTDASYAALLGAAALADDQFDAFLRVAERAVTAAGA